MPWSTAILFVLFAVGQGLLLFPAPATSTTSAVFSVQSESTQGSGFLVDPSGLVVTSYHVVADADWLAVSVSSEHKVEAVVLIADPAEDLALLRINPLAVEGIAPLPLLPEERLPTVGGPVRALIRPSAFDPAVIHGRLVNVGREFLSCDLKLSGGASGGPLVDDLNRVVGVVRFIEVDFYGAIRRTGASRLRGVRRMLRWVQADLGPPPSAVRLAAPVLSRIPVAELQSMVRRRVGGLNGWSIDSEGVDLRLLTPVSEAWLEHGRKRRWEGQGSPREAYAPVVTIQAQPELNRVNHAIYGRGLQGPLKTAKLEFLSSFRFMELERDGELVQPVVPGRMPQRAVLLLGWKTVEDSTRMGNYQYPPEAFAPGGELIARVWLDDVNEPREIEIPERVRKKVWRDLEPFIEPH